jgi:hypothetical protein
MTAAQFLIDTGALAPSPNRTISLTRPPIIS